MVDLISLLPLLEGWKWEIYYKGWHFGPTVYAVKGVRSELAHATDEKGWIHSAVFFSDDPFSHLTVDIDNYHYDESISNIRASGLVKENNVYFYVLLYDLPNKLYAVNFAPAYPMPYKSSFVVASYLDEVAGVLQSNVGMATLKIVIFDEDKFRKSLELGWKNIMR